MAEHEAAPDAASDLKYFLLLFLGLGFLWLAGGGYERYKQSHTATTTTETLAPTTSPAASTYYPRPSSTPVPTVGADVYIIQ